MTLYFLQPRGYSIDIYSGLPLTFYGALVLCYLIGTLIVFRCQGTLRTLGTLLLVLNQMLILIIPYMLGYYSMGRADDMSYIGEYLHIGDTGHIDGWDIYPGSLVLGAVFRIMTGLSANSVSFIMPILFSLVFTVGIFLCCRFFLKDDALVAIAIPASLILYMGPYNFLNVPHSIFFAYMPFFILAVCRYISIPTFSNTIVAIVPTLLVPFMHPFIVFFSASLLIAIILLRKHLSRYISYNSRPIVLLLVLLVSGFLAWFIYCNTLLGGFKTSVISYLRQTTEPALYKTTDLISRGNLDISKIVKLLFIYYGRYSIPLAIICIAIAIAYNHRNDIPKHLKNIMFVLAIFYCVFLLFEAILFLNPLISHQPDRLTNLNFIVYAQVPLFVISVYILLKMLGSHYICQLLIVLLLTGTWGLSFFGALDSPNTFRPNMALTDNEVQGMGWLYEVRDTYNLIAPLSQVGRFHSLFDEAYTDNSIYVKDHFGYDSSGRSFADINLQPGQRSYMVLLTYDELLYQQVPGYMELGRYTADDYRRIRTDRSVSAKIYDDVNIRIYDLDSTHYG